MRFNSEVVGRVEYSPYGLIVVEEGDMDTPFLYNGQWGIQTDANGLLNMRARYYSPYLMRFLNADPLEFSGGQNWFAYADGNPISMLDPFGLWGWRNSLSMALDFIPVVGTVKGVAELALGYDVIAGEDVNRAVAAAGVAASFIPGGKAAAKVGSKAFSRGLKSADEATEVATNVIRNGDGIIYKRTTLRNGDEYIGQSRNTDTFTRRQLNHNRNVGANNFDRLGSAESGLDLNILEETLIRTSGGLRKEGGTLVNKRHQMSVENYLNGVNQRLGEFQRRTLLQSGLLNGTVQLPNRLK